MPSWNDLLELLDAQEDENKGPWLKDNLSEALENISSKREDRNVILYASAFLQKPAVPAFWLQLSMEEINGFMSIMYGMDWEKGLTLIIHTPGGVTNSAETLVSYLHSKFPDFEVIVPTFAMSAGTMISLASHRIIMGRQSQLGPIDPQIPIGGRAISAQSIVDQFEQAKADILANQQSAHVWAPIIQSLGPALLQEASNALDYGKTIVSKWLEQGMFAGEANAAEKAEDVASHFSDVSIHKSHGRRIDRDEARGQDLAILDLEDDQELQDAVLTAYHLGTLIFEKSPTTKLLMSQTGRTWVKNFVPASASSGS